MVQPGMRITVDAAMRARDVSRPRTEDGQAPGTAREAEPVSAPEPVSGPGRAGEPARRTRAAKNERRRLGKRGGARKPPPDGV